MLKNLSLLSKRRVESPVWLTWAVGVLAVGVILLFWAVLPAALRLDEGSDYSAFYEPVARRLLAGHGLTTTEGSLGVRYPPGYPLVLAALFGLAAILHLPEAWVAGAFVLLCMGFTAGLVYALARLFWPPVPALVAALAWLTYPLALWLTKQPSSEVPFLPLVYGALYLFWRWARAPQAGQPGGYALVGGLLGLAMLIRPIAIGLPLVLVVILWAVARAQPWPQRMLLAGALLLGAGATVAPWEVALARDQGHFVPLSTAGSLALRDGLTFAVRLKGFRQGTAVPDDVRLVMSALNDRYDALDSYGAVAVALGEQWRLRPGAVVKLVLLKAARSWYGTDSQRYEAPIAVLQLLYLVAVLVGTVLAWHRGGPARLLVGSVWLIVGYFWLLNILSNTLVRYTVPVMGLLFLLLPALWQPLRRLPRPGVRYEIAHRHSRPE